MGKSITKPTCNCPPPLEQAIVIAAELRSLRASRRRLRRALKELTSEPLDLDYPEKDVYGMREKDDIAAPFWTECGLYGRVGKEAARTLLMRHEAAVNALRADSSRARGKGRGR